MPTIVAIISFTLLASILSLLLVGILLLHKTLVHKLSFYLVSFAAGALMATAFLDTMKEAVAEGGDSVYLWVTLAIAGFFILERTFLSTHTHDEAEDHPHQLRIPAAFLMFGDGMHNFIDGAAIAASFLVSFPLGVVTSLTVFVHEIPHELGDFGILLVKGWGRGKVLWFNVATGFTALAGALLTYYLGSTFKQTVPILLSITTANFIYLSATGLLPEIHHHAQKTFGLKHVLFFLAGIVMITILTTFLAG